MSKASINPIDRTTQDYKERKAALDIELANYFASIVLGDEYETPLPANVIEKMDELGVEIRGGEVVEVDAQPEQNLGADITKEQRDGVLAVDAAIKQNSNPQKNKEDYNKAKAFIDALDKGGSNSSVLKGQLKTIGNENKDAVFQAYLASVNAILDATNMVAERARALKVVQESFAFLGDENANHDLEASLLATRKICESDEISPELKMAIEEAVFNVDVEVVDNSPQAELESEKKKKEGAEKEAKEDKKKKEDLEKKEGINKANIAKKTVKYGAALGVAAGFPPFGIAIAIGMLYVARSWGADEKENGEAKAKEFEEGRVMMLGAKERIAEVKSRRLAQRKSLEVAESAEGDAPEGVSDPSLPEGAALDGAAANNSSNPTEGVATEASVLDGQSSDQGAPPPPQGSGVEASAPSPAATATGVAIGAVADDALADVVQAGAGLRNLAVGSQGHGDGQVVEPEALEEVSAASVQPPSPAEVDAAAQGVEDVSSNNGAAVSEESSQKEESDGAGAEEIGGNGALTAEEVAKGVVQEAAEEAAEDEKERGNPLNHEVKGVSVKPKGLSAA